jgi:nucleotide-binding universal stress UspA family protein
MRKFSKTILVPTDFSDNASNAADYALKLFSANDIKVYLLHSYFLSPSSPDVSVYILPEEQNKILNLVKQKLNNEAVRLKTSHGNVAEIEVFAKYGSVSDACIEFIREKPVDIITMGTHGASGVKKYLFGTNTAEVIKETDNTILVVPENFQYKSFKNILFATDFNDSDIEAITEMAKLAENNNARLIILHVSLQEEYEESMLDWFEELVKEKTSYSEINFRLLKEKEVLKSLKKFIREYKIDLLLMSTRKRTFMQHFFEGSLTKQMAFSTDIPMMVYRVEDKESDDLL